MIRFLGAAAVLAALLFTEASAQTLEDSFRTPPEEAKPLMIWEWMNGLVSREGITAELEAYKAAGIGGVQQFIVGGDMQTIITDPSNAVGTENWRSLMRFTLDECARLGLSFGTHNCPGWSSSGYPTVLPEFSMQDLVWSGTAASGNGKVRELRLPRPEVDPRWDYYRDVAVLAVPAEGTIPEERIVNLTGRMAPDGTLSWTVPDGDWILYRFGHTTNGKDNHGTAPEGGMGLECDKMSREAVDHFWSLYPAELLAIAGEHAGKAFQRLEIDSYEQQGQSWTPRMPEEFLRRNGYDILPWLPVLAGRTVISEKASARFFEDYSNTGQDLVAANYYGRMSELCHQNGLTLIAEPYGTGGKPFNPVITEKVVPCLHPEDMVAAEFWTKPETWGWPEVPSVVAAARRNGFETVWAEAFTSITTQAWKDDPDSLKRVGDRAFCLGINAFMLHAAAQNPWTHVKPGMTFGVWGTQWTPNQTWWKDGAPELFRYFRRCGAMLRRGRYVDDFQSPGRSLITDRKDLQWIHRQDGKDDFYFLFNRSDASMTTIVTLDGAGRIPELWDPETVAVADAPAWFIQDGRTSVRLDLNPGQSVFLVLRRPATDAGPGLGLQRRGVLRTQPVSGPWHVRFPEGWDAPEEVTWKELTPWNESEIPGIKYFSGTARYTTRLYLDRIDPGSRYVLDLGKVCNLAVVRINGTACPTLWRTPFRTDVTDLLRKGENILEIEVTNLWVNRLVGDEQEPEDILWAKPGRMGGGSLMQEMPEWLRTGSPRPSQGRKAVTSYKFFRKDSPLLPSGLLGPVVLRQLAE